jgi:hypothetical protein
LQELKKNPNIRLEKLIVVGVVVEDAVTLVILAYAGFVLGNWLLKEKFPVLKKQVGKGARNIFSSIRLLAQRVRSLGSFDLRKIYPSL